MATSPQISFRDNTPQANIISQLSYIFSTLGSNFLPVLQGSNSLPLIFRAYNNFSQNSSIASAMNVAVTVFDGMSTASHTALKQIVSQSWVRVYETGFGENSTPNVPYTAFAGSDTAIGGSPAGANVYFAEVGSDGGSMGQLRAGTGTQNGVGFLEFTTYVQVPQGATTEVWTFAIDLLYEWTS